MTITLTSEGLLQISLAIGAVVLVVFLAIVLIRLGALLAQLTRTMKAAEDDLEAAKPLIESGAEAAAKANRMMDEIDEFVITPVRDVAEMIGTIRGFVDGLTGGGKKKRRK